jgi:uncharacterized C2H2 Zn-finger protein
MCVVLNVNICKSVHNDTSPGIFFPCPTCGAFFKYMGNLPRYGKSSQTYVCFSPHSKHPHLGLRFLLAPISRCDGLVHWKVTTASNGILAKACWLAKNNG